MFDEVLWQSVHLQRCSKCVAKAFIGGHTNKEIKPSRDLASKNSKYGTSLHLLPAQSWQVDSAKTMFKRTDKRHLIYSNEWHIFLYFKSIR